LHTHVSKAMRALIAARDWLTVFQLPAYASELNPVESVWPHLKRSLASLVKRSLSELTALVKPKADLAFHGRCILSEDTVFAARTPVSQPSPFPCPGSTDTRRKIPHL